jgi:calcium/calmodulin-dependent protein kinase I
MGCGSSSETSRDSGSIPHSPAEHDGVVSRGEFMKLYRVGKTLGNGQQSEVRVCSSIASGKKYAVKIIKRKNLSKVVEDDLRNEVKMLRILDHPQIVRMIDFFEEEKYFYLVEEYIRGGELLERIAKKHVYNEKEARDVLLALLNAIKYCHDRDVVHRDLKPENLLLAHKGQDASIKIADFGFAAIAHGNTLNDFLGTLDYAAPEILMHKNYGKAVDMWSIGVIAYFLLGGHPPFFGDSDDIEMDKITHCDYQFEKEHWEHVSDDAKDLIRHLLEFDPSKRYTVDMALQHPWLIEHNDVLEQNNLQETLNTMKKRQRTKDVEKVASIAKVQSMYMEHHTQQLASAQNSGEVTLDSIVVSDKTSDVANESSFAGEGHQSNA